MTIKYRQSRTYSENLKLFNRVNPHRAANATAVVAEPRMGPDQVGLAVEAVPSGARHIAVRDMIASLIR